LEKNKNVKDQIEQLSQKQNLIFEELRKEITENQQYILGLEQNIHSMKEIIQSQNKIHEENLKKMELNINLLKSEREKDIKSIDNLRKYIGELEYKHEEDRKYINQILFQREEDKRKIDDLKFQNLKNKFYINELLIENKSLKNKINWMEKKMYDLVKYEFEIKLRKLLKKLIEYIFNKYFNDYMFYDEMKNKVFFYRSPKYIKDVSEKTIINALNEMLKILFYETKEGDYLVHFVNQNEKLGNRFYKKEKLFKNSKDFFIHFGLSQYENILIQIIPEEYFTTIDNLDFKIKISNLIKKHKNKKNNKLSANNFYKNYFQ